MTSPLIGFSVDSRGRNRISIFGENEKGRLWILKSPPA